MCLCAFVPFLYSLLSPCLLPCICFSPCIHYQSSILHYQLFFGRSANGRSSSSYLSYHWYLHQFLSRFRGGRKGYSLLALTQYKYIAPHPSVRSSKTIPKFQPRFCSRNRYESYKCNKDEWLSRFFTGKHSKLW